MLKKADFLERIKAEFPDAIENRTKAMFLFRLRIRKENYKTSLRLVFRLKE